jgi:hypothetical protein
MEHPKDVGDRSTLAIMLALRAEGLAVFIPFGENTRADLVIDDGVKLERVQCKTGRLRKGAVKWDVCSNYAHHANPKVVRRHYQHDVDYFAVYCPQTSGVYLIPIGDLEVRRGGSLRVDPPRNGQRKLIRFAKPYEIGRVILGGREPAQ